MASQRTDQRAAAQAAWREMARGMRKFIAIEIQRAGKDCVARHKCLAYVEEQIGIAIADAAGRLCAGRQLMVLTPDECAELTKIGYAMQRKRESSGKSQSYTRVGHPRHERAAA